MFQAQKTWAKKFHKVQKAKKDHHTACKLQKTAQIQENNARGDSGVSPDQVRMTINDFSWVFIRRPADVVISLAVLLLLVSSRTVWTVWIDGQCYK